MAGRVRARLAFLERTARRRRPQVVPRRAVDVAGLAAWIAQDTGVMGAAFRETMRVEGWGDEP